MKNDSNCDYNKWSALSELLITGFLTFFFFLRFVCNKGPSLGFTGLVLITGSKKENTTRLHAPCRVILFWGEMVF